MPTKKKRPLLKSYAGVVPSVSAKTKRPTDRQTIKDLADALLLVTQVSGATRAELAKAKEQLEKGEATMLENAGVVAELTAALAAKDKELAADARAFAAIDGERTFLWEEIDRFRNRLMDYIRWEMLLPEDARVALNKVRAQDFEDALDADADEAT